MCLARFKSAATAAAIVVVLGGTLIGCGSKNDVSASSTTTASASPSSTTKAGGPGTTKAPNKGGGGVCGTWSRNVIGEPKAKADVAVSGYFIWQDIAGWHVRVRAPEGKPAAYTGTITGSRDLASAKASPDGAATVEVKGNQLTFEIEATSELKGFDLNAGCDTNQLQFVLQAGGFPVAPDQISLGTNSKALGSTFTVEKTS